eukprot:TRINITY_DN18350_c0_g1_i3.p2 TRINITY_DN18350_c0_g1~~TRINITY_DN18350_c0_g1_i3.p2  ORF type:complete len:271 (+),score=-16.72 TRINITY_DN18350_c0_g1_i3:606-1418(+)
MTIFIQLVQNIKNKCNLHQSVFVLQTKVLYINIYTKKQELKRFKTRMATEIVAQFRLSNIILQCSKFAQKFGYFYKKTNYYKTMLLGSWIQLCSYKKELLIIFFKKLIIIKHVIMQLDIIMQLEKTFNYVFQNVYSKKTVLIAFELRMSRHFEHLNQQKVGNSGAISNNTVFVLCILFKILLQYFGAYRYKFIIGLLPLIHVYQKQFEKLHLILTFVTTTILKVIMQFIRVWNIFRLGPSTCAQKRQQLHQLFDVQSTGLLEAEFPSFGS